MVNTTAGVSRAAPQGGGRHLSALNHITSVCRSLESLLPFRFDVLGFIPILHRPRSLLDFDGAWLFNYGIGVQLATDRESRPPNETEIDPDVSHIPFTEFCMQHGFDNGLAPPTTPQGDCNSLPDLEAATFQADDNSTLDDTSFPDMEVAAFQGDVNDDDAIVSADSEGTTFHGDRNDDDEDDYDATFQDLEAATFLQGDGNNNDAAAAFQGEGITVSSWLAQLEKETREFLRSLVPGALLSRNQVISRLFWLGLLTLFSALKVVLYVPAAGPVFGRYRTGYYIILAVMLAAAVVELAASYWLSRSRGRAALAFANIVLQTAFPILLFVGTVGRFSIPLATIGHFAAGFFFVVVERTRIFK